MSGEHKLGGVAVRIPPPPCGIKRGTVARLEDLADGVVAQLGVATQEVRLEGAVPG